MKKLTRTEEDVMQMIWDHGPATVSALIEKMSDPKPPHSTISSIVRILEKKGFVDHNTYGRTHEYYAVIKKEDYSKFSLKNLVRNYFEGSMSDMVSFLVKEDDLSLNELSEMIYKLKDSEKENEEKS